MSQSPQTSDPAWATFSTLAATYRSRPGYAGGVFDVVRARLQPSETSRLIVDVGAGTGIFTRQLAERFGTDRIIGIEPSEHMRQAAVSASQPDIAYLDAVSSELPFPAGSVSLLTAANALHRFDREAYYCEAARVLRPGGVLLLIDNLPRPWGARFHQDYLSLQEGWAKTYRRGMNSDGRGGYIDLDPFGDLEQRPAFSDVAQASWPFEDYLDEDRLIELARSSSINGKAMVDYGETFVLDEIHALFRKHASRAGLVRMSFLTVAVLASRLRHDDRPGVVHDERQEQI